ncbi:MAG: helix-turn-helix domain-containing protein [Planctomycetaceae bacterium]|jgi:hypothetical protein|nr:helix-turn-helix domain-containing protein [Planctomycetaceae bacterium]
MLWATRENTLLSYETINKILTLLENGISVRKIAELADVSVWSVQKIANGQCSLKRSLNRSEPVRDHFGDSTDLNLHGQTLRRYLNVRKKVEEQIIAGKRSPLFALSENNGG